MAQQFVREDTYRASFTLLLSTYQSTSCCKKPSAMLSMLGPTLGGVLNRSGLAG